MRKKSNTIKNCTKNKISTGFSFSSCFYFTIPVFTFAAGFSNKNQVLQNQFSGAHYGVNSAVFARSVQLQIFTKKYSFGKQIISGTKSYVVLTVISENSVKRETRFKNKPVEKKIAPVESQVFVQNSSNGRSLLGLKQIVLRTSIPQRQGAAAVVRIKEHTQLTKQRFYASLFRFPGCKSKSASLRAPPDTVFCSEFMYS